MRHVPTESFNDASPWAIPSAQALPTRPATALAKIGWLLGLPGRVVAARRDMALLGRMTAVELADIGLIAQDVHDAAALPLGHAQAPLLARRAMERRDARYARHR